MAEPLELTHARRIFGAPGPQDTGGAVYSSVKATADAQALRADATAGAVNNVLGVLQQAMQVRAQMAMQERALQSQQMIEATRQRGMALRSTYEQEQQNARHAADRQAMNRRHRQDVQIRRRQGLIDYGFKRQQEKRAVADQALQVEQHNWQAEQAKASLALTAENLAAARANQKRLNELDKAQQIHERALMSGGLREEPDGTITPLPELMDTALRYGGQGVEEPGMALKVAGLEEDRQMKRAKAEQAIAKPQADAEAAELALRERGIKLYYSLKAKDAAAGKKSAQSLSEFLEEYLSNARPQKKGDGSPDQATQEDQWLLELKEAGVPLDEAIKEVERRSARAQWLPKDFPE